MAPECWHDYATQRRRLDEAPLVSIVMTPARAAPLIIILDEPQFGIAAGQAAALYHGDDADILNPALCVYRFLFRGWRLKM